MNSAETRAHAAWGIMVSLERRDQFVAALRALGGAAGNGRLREQLGWEDDEYRAVHAALTQDGNSWTPTPAVPYNATLCSGSRIEQRLA